MDVFVSADTPQGVVLDARVGGSPFNVAIALARLAQPVALFAGVSRDAMGERLMRSLRDEGVDTSCVCRTDAPTTLAVVGVGEGGAPSYSFMGEGGADRQLTAVQLAQLPRNVAALHVGSYGMVVEPIASTLRALVAERRGRAMISWDPNVRLAVVGDLERWRDVLTWMLPRTDLLKVSGEDLGLLLRHTSAESFAADALARGVRLVIVTLGSRGSAAWTSSAHATVSVEAIVGADTVGAGDAFQAAVLAWLAERGALTGDSVAATSRDSLRELLRFASQAASLTCARRGADPPHRAELG